MGVKNFLLSLLGGAQEPHPPDEPVERFGRTFVKRSRGAELLASCPKRKGWSQGIRDHINLGPQYPKEILIDRVLVRFALFVGDLPASEKDHDSGPYGLLNHSLEIAYEVVMALSKPGFKSSPDPVVAERERPAWVYAGFLAGLLHDVGKVFEIEVTTGDGEGELNPARWNPRVQPLVAFLESRGMKIAYPEHARFRPGRGFGTHERTGALLHAVVLPPSVIEFAGLPLTQVVEAYIEKSVMQDDQHLPEGARRVSETISNIEGRHRIQTRKATHHPQASTKGVPEPEKMKAPGPGPEVKPPPPPKPVPRAGRSVPNPAPKKNDSDSDKLMEPRALLEAVGRYIGSGRNSRNTNNSNVFIRSDWTWLLFPQGLIDVLTWHQIIYDKHEHPSKILQALSKSGQAFEQVPGSPKTLIRPRPECGQGKWAVGIQTSALFSPEVVQSLGFWPYEVGPLKPTTAELTAVGRASVA